MLHNIYRRYIYAFMSHAVNMCQYIYRTTILAAVAFLDAFQKVADMATNSRGKFIFY